MTQKQFVCLIIFVELLEILHLKLGLITIVVSRQSGIAGPYVLECDGKQLCAAEE